MTHTIVAQMNPSPEQLPAIEVRGHDLLVTAGAGSGKTLTLVARYLSLLADGLPLRSVVAITFTRKAAREMRDRVRQQVRAWLVSPDLAETERARWQQVYVDLDAARISTIHTLCGELLRAHPAEAGVDPRFEMLDEAQTELLRAEAVRKTLGWAADDAVVSGLFGLLEERGVRDLAAQLLAKRLDVAPLLAQRTPPWELWLARVLPPLQSFVQDPAVAESLGALQSLVSDGSASRALANDDGAAPDVLALAASWDTVCAAVRAGDWVTVSSEISAWEPHLKQRGKKENWGAVNAKPIIKELHDAYGMLPPYLIGGDLAVDRRLAEAMPAISRLFERLQLTYAAARETRRALDFDDLEQQALDLLARHPDVRARWQRDLQAILVDEFQDTNRRQYELITLLNGEHRRAFYVGDAKQSIYRFRGADVSVLRALQARATNEQAGLEAHSMRTSYRAHRELLTLLNTILRPVLGDQADGDLLPHRSQPGPGFEPPYLELHLTVGNRSGEGNAQVRAARALAARLIALMDRELRIEEGETSRTLTWGDFAILCRASSAFGAYEDALEDAGIPYMTVSGRGFYGRPEVRDLLNALRAIADPTDDLALTGLLRSPAIGLTDAALYRLCAQRTEAQRALWDVIRAEPTDLEPQERAIVQRAVALVGALHAHAGRTAVADLLKAYIDATNYRAALRWAGQGRAARNVAKLLADALESGIVSVGEFLAYVSALRDAGTRESEARAIAEGAVQIMSVHAAKGLEFPVVVLGDIAAGAHRPGGMLMDPDAGLLLPLKDDEKRGSVIYAWAQERAQVEEKKEAARLLYVAATRAREMLLLSGCIKLKQDGSLGNLGEALGALAEPLGLPQAGIKHDEEGAAALHLALQVGGAPAGCWVYEPNWAPEPAAEVAAKQASVDDLVEPVLLASLRVPPAPTSPEGGAIPGQRVWRVVPRTERARAPSWVVGQLVHEALAAWRFPGDGFEAWALARGGTLGLIDAQAQRDAVSRTRTLMERFRQHPLHEEIAAADQRLSEVPYSVRMPDGSTDSGSFDLLYRRGDAWTLVEVKSDHIRDRAQQREQVVEKGYDAQAARYQRAAEQLLGRRPRVLFCWLDVAGQVALEPFASRADAVLSDNP